MRSAAWTVMMTMATGLTAYAGHGALAAGPTVMVCADTVPSQGISPGIHMMTTAMFARIGVKLAWREYSHCPAGALQISLSTRTPADLRPGALAYAFPYEGTHIVVFLDRIRSSVESDRLASALLVHVFAHEITHILQGYERHSDSGLMKAKWDRDDYRAMSSATLPFTQEDIVRIHLGMEFRKAALAPAAAVR